MRPDLEKLFAAQAAWQRARAKLAWPEKVRLSEIMRESARLLRSRASARGNDRESGACGPVSASRASGQASSSAS